MLPYITCTGGQNDISGVNVVFYMIKQFLDVPDIVCIAVPGFLYLFDQALGVNAFNRFLSGGVYIKYVKGFNIAEYINKIVKKQVCSAKPVGLKDYDRFYPKRFFNGVQRCSYFYRMVSVIIYY